MIYGGRVNIEIYGAVAVIGVNVTSGVDPHGALSVCWSPAAISAAPTAAAADVQSCQPASGVCQSPGYVAINDSPDAIRLGPTVPSMTDTRAATTRETAAG